MPLVALPLSCWVCTVVYTAAEERRREGVRIMQVTTRPAQDADTPFARAVHHAAYRDVVERQFGPWNEAAQDQYFATGWDPTTCQIV